MLPALRDRLPPGWSQAQSPTVDRLYSVIVGGTAPRRGVRTFNLLYADPRPVMRATSLDVVLDAFESNVQIHVAELAPRRLFVHAGVVGWRGRAIVIPGASHSGKSELIAALVRAGATYYSDEYALLDEGGRVHPYPRPIALRDGRRRQRVDACSLGGVVGTRSLPIGLVALTRYLPDAAWRPRRLTNGRAVMALLGHTVAARRSPRVALAVLPQAIAQADVVKSARGECDETARSLLRRLERTA